MNLDQIVEWFQDLKAQGATKDEILDILEFDSDEYPDMELLEEAREIVYGNV